LIWHMPNQRPVNLLPNLVSSLVHNQIWLSIFVPQFGIRFDFTIEHLFPPSRDECHTGKSKKFDGWGRKRPNLTVGFSL
jgi:hypothetical protein